MKNYEAFVFDLDGTLLDTLDDLVTLTNASLESFGYPVRTKKEIHGAIGGGLRQLMERAIPAGTAQEQVEALYERWLELYPKYGIAQTKIFSNMFEVVEELKQRDRKLAVLSNKNDRGVQDAIPRFFPDIFDIYRGVSEAVPRKPDPQGLLDILTDLEVKRDNAVYIGDSPTDIKTARAAGVDIFSVSWGYRTKEVLLEHSPTVFIEKPDELLRYARD